MSLLLLENEYATRLVGVRERTVAEERPADDPVRGQLLEIVHQVLAGKLKPSVVRHGGTVDFDRLEITEYERKADPKRNRTITVPKATKLALRHVTTVKRFTRGRDLREYDDNGKPVKPFVSMSFEDGTSIEVPYTAPKAAKD